MLISWSITPVADPLVDPLVVAAEENEMRLPGQLLREGRRKRRAVRGQVDAPAARGLQLLDRGEDRLRLQHHAGPAAKGPVIGRAVLVESSRPAGRAP